MVHISILQKLMNKGLDLTIALFDGVTMSPIEKGLIELVRWKLHAKLQTLCWEHKIQELAELINFCETNIADAKLSVNRIIAFRLPQGKRNEKGTFLGPIGKGG